MLTKCCGDTRGKSLNPAWDTRKVFAEEVTFNLVLETEVVSRQRRNSYFQHESKNVEASRPDQVEVCRELQ